MGIAELSPEYKIGKVFVDKSRGWYFVPETFNGYHFVGKSYDVEYKAEEAWQLNDDSWYIDYKLTAKMEIDKALEG